MKKISVIISCYNHTKFINRCLRSILHQSLDKELYDIVVVDDSSTDNSLKKIQSYGKFIKIIKNKKNKGLPFSLNTAIKKSNSEYIVRLDSDDFVNYNFLLFLLKFIENNKDAADAACTDYYTVNNNGKFLTKENSQEKPIGCGIIFKKKHLLAIGLYNKKYLMHEEIELRIRYDKKFRKVLRVQLPLYRYRKHNNNLTNNKITFAKYRKSLQLKQT